MAMKISDIEFAGSIYKRGGTSSQFLKADGSIDSNTYALNSALSGYLPLSGGTLTNNLTLGNGSDLIITPASSGGNATLYNDIGNLVSTASLEVQGTGTFSSTIAGYGLSVTNVEDSSQGLLVRSSDADTTLYLARFQSSASAVSQTWVDRFSIAKNGSTVIGDNIPFTNIRLYVKGSSTSSSDYALNVADTNGADIAWFRNDKTARFYGNVGIGTNPSEALHVYSSGTSPRPALFLETASASSTPEVRLFQTSGRAILMNLQTNGDWSFQNSTNNSTYATRFTIASGGAATFSGDVNVGNGSAQTRLLIDSLGGSGQGPFIRFNKANVAKAYIGAYSAIISGTSDDFGLYSVGGYQFMVNNSTSTVFSISTSGAATFSGNIAANSPSEGNTGEGIVVGRSFKIDATGSGQTAKMYVVSNTLSDTYGSGLQIQFAKLTNDAGFGFNLNTSGGFETYVKAGAGSWNRAILVDSSAVTRIEALRINNLLVEYSKNLTGSYSAGNFYEIVNSSQMASGIYILRAYVDTYAAGGGTYFVTYASVPFYFYTGGTNNTGAQTLPTMIGSGHANYVPPIIRIRLSPNADGKTYLEFDPNATWTNLTGGGGATVTFNLLRISS